MATESLSPMPDATFTSAGFKIPLSRIENLPQDPTPDLPYDTDEGVMTVWHEVTADTLLLHSETLDSTATDLDLFVGRDANGDGIAQASEELCSSTTATAIEFCDLLAPVAGDYWVLVQNWEATLATDEATLITAVIGEDTSSPLAVSGNGIAATATPDINLPAALAFGDAEIGSTVTGSVVVQRSNSFNGRPYCIISRLRNSCSS